MTNQVTKEARDKQQNHQNGEEGKMKRVTGSGAIFFLNVDGKDIQVESAIMTARDVIAVAGHDPNGCVLIQLFKDGQEKNLEGDDKVSLSEYGIERFKTEKIFVTIQVNQHPFKVKPGNISVKELKILVGVPLAHNLAEVSCDALHTLPDDGVVCISGGEKFVSFPRDGQAS